jgi:hypothetical protein
MQHIIRIGYNVDKNINEVRLNIYVFFFFYNNS